MLVIGRSVVFSSLAISNIRKVFIYSLKFWLISELIVFEQYFCEIPKCFDRELILMSCLKFSLQYIRIFARRSLSSFLFAKKCK